MLVVESHDEGPRPGWRRGVKGTIVPPIVRGASSALVTGTLAQRSVVERGAQPERVRVFANTIDVEAFGERADALAARRSELRAELGAGPDDVVVLSVSRLVPEKAHDVLVRAVAEADDPRLLLVLAGDGPERARLASLAAELDVRLVLAGDRPWDTIVEVYAAADVFALLSEREPWAVVVNEAIACGLPLVLSDRVGAGHDLLHDGENGVLVHAGDVAGRSCRAACARERPGGAPPHGCALARDRARLGLRAERRQLPRGRSRGNEPPRPAVALPGGRAEPPPANRRPQPVLLARSRGDRAPPDRALRGARRRLRGRGGHRGPARPRGRAARARAQRRSDRPRGVDGVRARRARPARGELPLLSELRAAPRVPEPRARISCSA